MRMRANVQQNYNLCRICILNGLLCRTVQHMDTDTGSLSMCLWGLHAGQLMKHNVEWKGRVLQFAAHQLCMPENEKFCRFIYTSSSRKRLMSYFRL